METIVFLKKTQQIGQLQYLHAILSLRWTLSHNRGPIHIYLQIKYRALQICNDTNKSNIDTLTEWCKPSNKLHRDYSFKNVGYKDYNHRLSS